MFNNSDKNWEIFGKTDPYYGVLSHEKFHINNITQEDLISFFKSGDDYITNLFKKIENLFPNFKPKLSLDFGCGVGRLLIPLSKISLNAVGVDVSESMLTLAKKNIESLGINNINLFLGDDNLSEINETFDFIHSYIVFQHIPVKRGEVIFNNLLSLLKHGGVCVCHFTYSKLSARKVLGDFIRTYFPFGDRLLNLIYGRPLNTPSMQMNNYNVNSLFRIVLKHGVKSCYVDFTNHHNELGFLLIFQKK
jgi:SAM-dependent methyltransferase